MTSHRRENNSPSLIRIADVLRSGSRLNTDDEGAARYLLPGLDVSLASIPAGAQGGDFYGMVYLQEGRTAIFVGDISGHDFSSSIVATQVIEYMDNHQESLAHPHLFLHEMSNTLYDTLSSVGRFFTAALCVVDVECNTLSYASAGHPPAMHFHHAEQTLTLVGDKSLPVGFEEGISYKLLQRLFLPGDVMLIYTDGISSARSADKSEFGLKRLAKHVQRCAARPSTLVPRLITAVHEFSEGATGIDDITAICLVRG